MVDSLARIYRIVDDVRARRLGITAASQQSFELLREACRDPVAVQTALLTTLAREHRDTEFGRAHGFADLDSLAAFRERVPIHSYDELRSQIDRMCAGEPDILVPDHPAFIAQTSGTTGAPKLVPFGPHMAREFLPFLLASYGAVEADIPGAVAGKQMILSRFVEGATASGIPVGAASGFVRELLASELGMAPIPGAVFDEPRLEVRYYAMLLYMLAQPLVWLSALNPSTLLTMFEQLDGFAEQLAEDLASGRCDHGPGGIAALMAGRPFVPAPDKADRLRRTFAATGHVDLVAVCPELRVVTTWMGGNAKHYLDQLRARLHGCELRSEVSGSSEGALLVPLDAHTEGGIPALFSTIIEFLPAQATPSNDALHDLEDLRPDQGYRLVVTNRRGMMRLVMDDLFYLERYDGRTPVLRFSHRHGHRSSLTGEKLTEAQVMEAIGAARAETAVDFLDYQVRPEWGEPPTYAILLELATTIEEGLEEFVASFETTLAALNLEYAAKRASRRLGPPSIIVLPPGELRRWQQQELRASGRSDAQAKIPRLHRELLPASPSYRRIYARAAS
jgi:hypothetical protein